MFLSDPKILILDAPVWVASRKIVVLCNLESETVGAVSVCIVFNETVVTEVRLLEVLVSQTLHVGL